MSDKANPLAGTILLGSFTKSELIAKLTELSLEIDATLKYEIDDTYASMPEGATTQLYLKDGFDLAEMHHHRHCRREWICDSNGCQWVLVCDLKLLK